MFDVTVIRPNAKFLLLRVLLILFTADTIFAFLVVMYLLVLPNTTTDRFFLIILLALHTLKFLVVAVMIGGVITDYLKSRFYISKHHLIQDKGLLNEEDKVYELKFLKSIKLNQDALGKRLHYGNIRLDFASRGYEDRITLFAVSNPHHIVKEFEKHLND